MKLAIMQPYLFPYIGYFQLIEATDKFVFYDDVTYIKQGWINRNKILVNNGEVLFTVPLANSSSNVLIKDVKINSKLFPIWREKFYKTIEMNYKKAPYFASTFELITNILSVDCETISELAKNSVITISNFVRIQTEFVWTSSDYRNIELKSKARVIDICKLEKASTYINPIGGQALYSKDEFLNEKIKLDFVKPVNYFYNQFSKDFVPWLSIIDIIMFNSIDEVNKILNSYELI
jgi:hypothetical protein